LKKRNFWLPVIAATALASLTSASSGICDTPQQLASSYAGGTPHATIKAHANSIDALAYSPQGTNFATGSWSRDPKWGVRGEVKLWDTQGKLQKTLQGHAATVKALAFSPDGQILASGAYDKTLILFNTRSGAATKLPNRHSAPIILLSFSRDGRQLVSGDEGGTLIFWEMRTLRPVQERFLRGYSGRIRAYAYSWQNDLLATADASQAVMLWRGERGSPRLLTKNRGLALSLAFSPDGKLLASANYSDVWLWDVDSGNDVSGLVHGAPVDVLAFSPEGSILACGLQNGGIVLHQTDYPVGSPISLKHGAKVNVLAFSPTRKGLVSGSTDGTVIVWR
jgi:WD40 repeat protein